MHQVLTAVVTRVPTAVTTDLKIYMWVLADRGTQFPESPVRGVPPGVEIKGRELRQGHGFRKSSHKLQLLIGAPKAVPTSGGLVAGRRTPPAVTVRDWL